MWSMFFTSQQIATLSLSVKNSMGELSTSSSRICQCRTTPLVVMLSWLGFWKQKHAITRADVMSWTIPRPNRLLDFSSAVDLVLVCYSKTISSPYLATRNFGVALFGTPTKEKRSVGPNISIATTYFEPLATVTIIYCHMCRKRLVSKFVFCNGAFKNWWFWKESKVTLQLTFWLGIYR